jgi:hypothetical protein
MVWLWWVTYISDQQIEFVEASEVRRAVDKDYDKYFILLNLVLSVALKSCLSNCQPE